MLARGLMRQSKEKEFPMAYTRNLHALAASSLTEEGRAKTCGYWYCVSDHGTAHTAFRTREAFVQWLDDRGLTVERDIPAEGEGAYFAITGQFRTALHMDRAEFDAIKGKARLQISNGDFTLATIAPDGDGIMCEHVLNPNVADRPKFDYRTAQALQDAGKAGEFPPLIGGWLAQTVVHSNGRGRIDLGETALDTLLEMLATYPLDRSFERFGDFIERDVRDMRGEWLDGIEGAVLFFGNFATYSHVFRITTNDPATIERLSSAIAANKLRSDYLRQPPPYYPEKLVIERKRFSTTQGEVLLTYDGKRIEQYGDQIELRGGEWRGRDDAIWHDVAKRDLARRHVAAFGVPTAE